MLTYLTVERKAILLCERRMLQVPRCTHMTGFSDPPRGKLKQASPQQSRWPRESDLLSLELMAQYGRSALGVSRHRTQNVGFIPADITWHCFKHRLAEGAAGSHWPSAAMPVCPGPWPISCSVVTLLKFLIIF